MAQHTKHKLRLPAPQPEPTTFTDPSSFKNQNSKYSSAADTSYSGHHRTHHLSNAVRSRLLTVTQKVRKPTVDTHFQAKPLNVSADFETSKNKTNHAIEKQQRKKTEEPRQLPEPKSKPSLKEKGGFEDDKIVSIKKLDSLFLEKEPRKSTGEVEAQRRISGSMLVASGGRRKSFGGLQVELSDVFASSGVKIVSVDMPPFMQIHAVDCARKTCDSLEKFTCKTLALTLKKEFDGVYGPAWHCIVGKSFGSFVTHSVGGFIYFSIDQKMYILLFKTTVQKAD